MPDGTATSGPFNHPERARRDGYYDTLDPESGERLLLARYDIAQQIASGAGWSTAFGLQQQFAGMSPAAWWPVAGYGVDGGIAYVAYPVWKATLADDISKGYRCNGAEALALARCLLDGLAQLEAAAQRPHAAIRTHSIVFPARSGGEHDSLSPRLTGLIPIEETDPRQHHADRRQVGYLLYGAIVGADPNFRSEPDFGSIWDDISIPDKKGWRKLIEELTAGELDNQSYDQIRKRLTRLGGGGAKRVWVGVGVAGLAALIGVGFKMGWFKGGEKGPVVVENGGGGGTNGGEPPWQQALNSQPGKDLVTRISPGSMPDPDRMQSALGTWWQAVPRIPADVWLKLEYPAPGPLQWNGEVVGVLEAEYQRRVGFTNAVASLRRVQGRIPRDMQTKVEALGWGQSELTKMLTTRGVAEAQAVVERMGPVRFEIGFNPESDYGTALSNALASVGVKSSDHARWWSGLDPAEKRRAVENLGTVWRTNIQGWAEFGAKPDPEISLALTNLLRFAGDDLKAVESQVTSLRTNLAGIQSKARTREFADEKALRDAEGRVLAGLRGVTNDLQRLRALAADQLAELERQRAAQLAEQRRLELERLREQDQSWVGLAETMGRTNLVEAVRQLEDRLDKEEKVGGTARTNFPASVQFVTDKKSFADRLAENLRNDTTWSAEASGPDAVRDPKDAFRKLKERLKDKGGADFPKSTARLGELERLVAGLEDGEWAGKARESARTGTLDAAIQSLEGNGVGKPGSASTNSAALLVKLKGAKDWLGMGSMALGSPDWKPAPTPPMPPDAGWREYAEVKEALALYEVQATAWTNAVVQTSQVNSFGTKQQFTELRDQLNAVGLANKTGLRTQRERLETLVRAIGLVEGGRAGGTSSSIASAIAEADRHREIRYFSDLLPELEKEKTRLKESEERLAREQREKAERAEKSEAIKAEMVAIAKSVGGVKLFGQDLKRVAGVTANVARVKKRELAVHERAYFELNPEDSAVRAEVLALQKRLEGIIAND